MSHLSQRLATLLNTEITTGCIFEGKLVMKQQSSRLNINNHIQTRETNLTMKRQAIAGVTLAV